MFPRGALILLVAALCGCTVQVGRSADEEVNIGTAVQQEEVSAAARRIAALLDQGRAGETWELAGPVLKAQESREGWSRQIAAVRTPLGRAGRRSVEGFSFPAELPEVGAGEFGLIAFRTDFSNAKGLEEKFVFQRIGGEWKLIGYWLSRRVSFGSLQRSVELAPSRSALRLGSMLPVEHA